MKRGLLSLLFLCSVGIAVHGQNISATYTTPNAGELDGIPFALTFGSQAYEFLDTDSYTNTLSYCSPLTANEEHVEYASGQNWSITFDQPVQNLRVYFICLRSASNGNFSEAGMMLSGQGGFL